MLGKLIKYEIKSTYRTFVSLYLIILILSIINPIFITFDFAGGITGVTLILACLYISLITVTTVFTITRFYKNILGDEGYLMNTLPVSSKSLILSKLIGTLIWGTLGILTASISGLILLSNSYTRVYLHKLFSEIGGSLKTLMSVLTEKGVGVVFILLILLIIVQIIGTIFQAYFCMSMTQIYPFTKKRLHSGIMMFVGINLAISIICSVRDRLFPDFKIKLAESSSDVLMMYLAAMLLISLVTTVAYFLASCYIINKKLNLE